MTRTRPPPPHELRPDGRAEGVGRLRFVERDGACPVFTGTLSRNKKPRLSPGSKEAREGGKSGKAMQRRRSLRSGLRGNVENDGRGSQFSASFSEDERSTCRAKTAAATGHS